ncbi:hypothetical protein [Nocardia nepalensis]|uniref:hypothetical protein n=1 Tax=Nocardia nepalensis TaxID=3375448 RepID=UPI003B6715A7
MTDNDAPRLSVRLNRLFDTFHQRTVPEQTNDVVAHSVSIMVDRVVPADEIARIRSGLFDNHQAPDPVLVEALARHFGVPPEYLAESGERVEAIDAYLRLIAAARDAGVNGLALRGDDLDYSELASIFAKLTQRQADPTHTPMKPLPQ